MSIINRPSVSAPRVRRLAQVVGDWLIGFASRVDEPARPAAPRVDPRELARRQQIRQAAERRREEALLDVLAGPHRF